MHTKLFVPGPTEVSEDTLQTMAEPMIGHRSKEFAQLHKQVVEKLQTLLFTKGRVFLSTSSATGVWEGAVRNCVAKKVLHISNGAFSERWAKVSTLNGKEIEHVKLEWGEPITAELVDKHLSTGEFDAFAFVHNETSTGVMSDIEAVAEVMKKYPDVIFMVDAVSSMSGVKIEVDRLGIDVCLASVQKAFSVAPGLAVFSVSDKAMEKAKTAESPGYYFNFLDFDKYAQKDNTPTTPPIPQIRALNHQLDKFLKEGIENRFNRHKEMAETVQTWAKEKMDLFPQEGCASLTVTCVKNTKGIDVGELNKQLEEKHNVIISNGYGKLKQETFRIAHMGDQTVEETKELLAWMDEIIASM